MLRALDTNRHQNETHNASGVWPPQGAKQMTAASDANFSLVERPMR